MDYQQCPTLSLTKYRPAGPAPSSSSRPAWKFVGPIKSFCQENWGPPVNIKMPSYQYRNNDRLIFMIETQTWKDRLHIERRVLLSTYMYLKLCIFERCGQPKIYNTRAGPEHLLHIVILNSIVLLRLFYVHTLCFCVYLKTWNIPSLFPSVNTHQYIVVLCFSTKSHPV